MPTASGHSFTYTNIFDFPRAFQTTFREEFKHMYLTPGHPDRKPLYEVFVRREMRATMAERGTCVHIKVYSRRHSEFTFEGSMGNTNRACDCCTRLERFCARIVEVDKVYQMVIFPVRERLRRGKQEGNMNFWRIERK